MEAILFLLQSAVHLIHISIINFVLFAIREHQFYNFTCRWEFNSMEERNAFYINM